MKEKRIVIAYMPGLPPLDEDEAKEIGSIVADALAEEGYIGTLQVVIEDVEPSR